MFNYVLPDDTDKSLEKIPPDLSILPLRNTVAFPFALMPLSLGTRLPSRTLLTTVKIR